MNIGVSWQISMTLVFFMHKQSEKLLNLKMESFQVLNVKMVSISIIENGITLPVSLMDF